MTDRILYFTGIYNFRDYGDYAAADGARVRAGVLWRSSQHRDATAEDLAKVEALSLDTVVDLRGDFERTSFPCPRPKAFAANVVFAAGDTAGNGPHSDAVRDIKTADEAHEAMIALYKSMPFRPPLIAVYRLYFEALATRTGPNLIHCLAGKDRTGIAVALLHTMLGVHADDMMADYLLTNSAGNLEARIAAGAPHVRSGFGADMDDAAVRTLMSVHPAYLNAGFEAIIDRHGSLESYCTDMLGVTHEQRSAIKQALLV